MTEEEIKKIDTEPRAQRTGQEGDTKQGAQRTGQDGKMYKRMAYVEEKMKSDGWKKQRVQTKGNEELVKRMEGHGFKRSHVISMLAHLFGDNKRGIKGEITQLLDEGYNVELDSFGMFKQRKRKARVTNDLSSEGMLYSPESSTVFFKPSPTMRLDHAAVSMAANMPTEPLPEGVHVSQRVSAMRFYKDWERRVSTLCNGQ